MVPTLRSGDAILVTNFSSQSLKVGDIVVFQVLEQSGFPVPVFDKFLNFQLPTTLHPIVHRIFRLRHRRPRRLSSQKLNDRNNLDILTKGDQNWNDDRRLYEKNGLSWLRRENLLGKVRMSIPSIGKIKDLLFGNLKIKTRRKKEQKFDDDDD